MTLNFHLAVLNCALPLSSHYNLSSHFFSLSYRFLSFFNFLFLDFYFFKLILLLRSGDVHPNPGPQFFKILYANIRGLRGNLNDLGVASTKYDMLFCSETLVSDLRHVSEILIPNFRRPILLRRGSIPRAQGLAVYIRSSFSAARTPRFECGCHETVIIRVCSRYHNFYLFPSYRNPDLDDGIYDCLLNSMAAIQEADTKASFIFVGDFNAHHRDWLGSVSQTNCHGHAALNFANLSGCEQLVHQPTHVSGNCLDLLLTDVPSVVDVRALAPVGGSDHSALSIKVQTGFSVPDINITRKVYLKSRADWNGVISDMESMVWSDIYRAASPIDSLNNALLAISNRRIPTRIIRSRARDKAWFNDDCRRAQRDKQEAYSLWSRTRSQVAWNDYVHLRSVAQRIYYEAQCNHNNHLRNTLAGASQPHVWWSALKQSLFGVDSSLPSLVCSDGSLCHLPAEKAELLSQNFNRKQCGADIPIPQSCFPDVKFTKFAFRSSELTTLLNDLNAFGGCDPHGFLPLFFKKSARILAPKLAVVFRLLLNRGSFPVCWRVANVTPIPKGGSPSVNPEEYRPISITPILSKIFERLLAKRLYRFLDASKLLPPNQFGFRKGLGTNDALMHIVHNAQSSLDSGHESRLVSLDFSSAFDRVNHKALIYKLKLLGIGGSVLGILTDFLSERRQRVSVDGSFSQFSTVLSGVPQGSVLGPLMFIIFTADMWSNIESDMVSYADDTTLSVNINSTNDRLVKANMLCRDISRIKSWCDRWGMKLNPSKSRSLIVSRSRTPQPQHPVLNVDNDVIPNFSTLKLLGVTLDSKLTFETHVRSVVSCISQKLGLLRKCRRIYADDDIVMNSFYSFILPHFEYCSLVWNSAAETHLRLLDRVFNQVKFLLPSLNINLRHRRMVGSLSYLFKIFSNVSHPLRSLLPEEFRSSRITRGSQAMNAAAFSVVHCRTTQFSRCFVPDTCKRWNSLPDNIVNSKDIEAFKSRVNLFILP